jgi:ketosteroid isomerase-like protein
MRALIHTVLVLVGCIAMDPAFAQPPGPSTASVADAIKQRVRDWADAMTVVDLDKLNQIIADDWVETGTSGKFSTKANFLDGVKSGAHKLESCDFGPEEVKVLGDVAVIQGTVTERWMKDGQLNTSHVAFMDVFVKRGDRWVVVRSHANKI